MAKARANASGTEPTVSQPSGGLSTPASAAVPPSPTSLCRSAQESGSVGSARAANGETSGA